MPTSTLVFFMMQALSLPGGILFVGNLTVAFSLFVNAYSLAAYSPLRRGGSYRITSTDQGQPRKFPWAAGLPTSSKPGAFGSRESDLAGQLPLKNPFYS